VLIFEPACRLNSSFIIHTDHRWHSGGRNNLFRRGVNLEFGRWYLGVKYLFNTDDRIHIITPLLMPRGHATNDENDEFHEWYLMVAHLPHSLSFVLLGSIASLLLQRVQQGLLPSTSPSHLYVRCCPRTSVNNKGRRLQPSQPRS
jgi:hypothetical protein